MWQVGWALGDFVCIFSISLVSRVAFCSLAEVGRGQSIYAKSWTGCYPICLPVVCGVIPLTSTVGSTFGIFFFFLCFTQRYLYCVHKRWRSSVWKMNSNIVITDVILCYTTYKMYCFSLLRIKFFFRCFWYLLGSWINAAVCAIILT